MKEQRDEIIKILKKYTFSDEVWVNFSDETNIINDLKINSARIVDIVIDLEETYDIEINDSQLENLKRFKDIVTLIQEMTI